MKKVDFWKASMLLPLRKEIDNIAVSIYQADDFHHGSNCKVVFESGNLYNAHQYLKMALESIDQELQRL